MDRPLRVALLSYRSKPHCGGQGIYVRHLSRELAALGHAVEVLSGPPYPELEPGPVLGKLPSLDLYRDDDPFRTPHLREYRDWIDVRAAQGGAKLSKWRWYAFVRMQSRVARRVGDILTVSESSRRDICADFKVPHSRVHVIPLGVDTRVFHPRGASRMPGQVVAVASADSPMKGVAVLLHAVAKLATERDVRLTVVSKPTPGGPTERLAGELALGDRVRFVHGISDGQLAELLASAEIAVVPSLYEGFSLPAVEHMASGTPLVVSSTGALPEVVGDAAVQVRPGDTEALAVTLRELYDSPERRARLGEAAWVRAQRRFAWPAVAKATVARYAAAIAQHAGGTAVQTTPATSSTRTATKGAEPC